MPFSLFGEPNKMVHEEGVGEVLYDDKGMAVVRHDAAGTHAHGSYPAEEGHWHAQLRNEAGQPITPEIVFAQDEGITDKRVIRS